MLDSHARARVRFAQTAKIMLVDDYLRYLEDACDYGGQPDVFGLSYYQFWVETLIDLMNLFRKDTDKAIDEISAEMLLYCRNSSQPFEHAKKAYKKFSHKLGYEKLGVNKHHVLRGISGSKEESVKDVLYYFSGISSAFLNLNLEESEDRDVFLVSEIKKRLADYEQNRGISRDINWKMPEPEKSPPETEIIRPAFPAAPLPIYGVAKQRRNKGSQTLMRPLPK